LISFVEFYRELGVEGITVYKETNDFDISRVLAHYRREGFVREVAWDWSQPLPALLDYHGQKLLLQDCLLRNRGLFKFLAFSDLDERLLPSQDTDLLSLLISLDQKDISAFGFHHVLCLISWRMDLK